jgi:UDP-glucose 4-epimerase
MRVLVTGGAGYIGSHVLLRLLEAGHDAVAIDDLSAGHRSAVLKAPLVVADFADPIRLAELSEAGMFDAVIHLAAHSQVGESVSRPEKYYRTNLVGSLDLLAAARHLGWGGLVLSSTAAVYGDPESLPITESHPTRPTNPYGDTKLAFERALEAHRVAHGFPYVSLRYFNAAGADPQCRLGEDHGASESHLIPNALAAALHPERTVRIFGTDYPTSDGTAVRDYIHVSDLADAHVLALDRIARRESGIFNLGQDEGFSVREVIEVCRRVTGRPIRAAEDPRRTGDPAILVASSERARAELGWSPRRSSLEVIVRTAWEWFRSHPGGYGD